MQLKAKQIEHAKEGMHADGKGLYLRVQASGVKSWIYRYQINGKRREMGLGTLETVSPNEARAQASALYVQLKKDRLDPLEIRRAESEKQLAQAAADKQAAAAAVNTFKVIAEEYITSHTAGWKSVKHSKQWSATLETYAYPTIGSKPVSEVNTDDVLAILKPIWATKTETASRVRSRMELVLSYAKAKKLRQGENPAVWRGHLDALLPKPSKVQKKRHQPALPYAQMPEFMAALKQVDGMGARALEFAILTAARSGEVRGAVWSEFDLEAGVWVVPAERMKAESEHRVPLSADALALLIGLDRFEGCEFLFPGERKEGPLSDMTLSAVTRRMNENKDPMPWTDPKNGDQIVPHGFRSSFRDWAAEKTDYPKDMAEMALAHTVGDKVEAAYRRGDMFEKRYRMMEDWAVWCAPCM